MAKKNIKIENNKEEQKDIIRTEPISQQNPGIEPSEMPAAVKAGPEKASLEGIIKDTSKKENRYVKVILIVMLLIIIIIIAVIILKNNANNFEYVGVQFEKIMFDKLLLYHAKIPITSITGEVVANFNLYLRNDPRTLEYIPVKGRILMKKMAIVALDPNMDACSDNAIAGVNLGQFLAAAGVKALGGSTNQTIAYEKGISYAACNNDISVIITEMANATQIIQEGESCYKIQVASCDDLVKATERFIVATIGHSSGYEIG